MNQQVSGRDRILHLLASDSRLAPKQIAPMVGMSEDEVVAAIKECEESGIIRRYHALIDWERAGSEPVVAFIDVSVSPARDVGFDRVASRIYRYREVQSVFLVSGGSDLIVQVEGENLKDVAQFVAEKLAIIDHVTGTQTRFLLRKYKEHGEILVEDDEDQRLAVTP